MRADVPRYPGFAHQRVLQCCRTGFVEPVVADRHRRTVEVRRRTEQTIWNVSYWPVLVAPVRPVPCDVVAPVRVVLLMDHRVPGNLRWATWRSVKASLASPVRLNAAIWNSYTRRGRLSPAT